MGYIILIDQFMKFGEVWKIRLIFQCVLVFQLMDSFKEWHTSVAVISPTHADDEASMDIPLG